ncbi:MAG: hypothetical protein KGO82_17250, partial [Bacteroidota bacterium]|nr:hypothetical protein [Bacteroidota bacterium]
MPYRTPHTPVVVDARSMATSGKQGASAPFLNVFFCSGPRDSITGAIYFFRKNIRMGTPLKLKA